MMNRVVVLLAVFGSSVVRPEEDLGRINTGASGVHFDDDGDSFSLDGALWGKHGSDRSENGHRSFHSNPDFNRNEDRDQEDRHKLSLKEFLETYAKKHNKKPVYYDDESEDQIIPDQASDKKNSKDKSKSTWTLLDVQRNKHPYDDRKGWVSLDPVPWSMSKISKWQSKYKPASDRPWDEHGPISSQRPYIEDEDLEFNRPVSITPPSPYDYHRPTESSDKYDTYYDHGERPRPTPSSTNYPRPTAYFGHKVHVETHFPSNSYSSSTGKPYPYHSHKHPNRPYDEIITDGQPSNFPQPNPYDSFRRRGTEMEIHSDTHPFAGDGEWVLLSTTKGYKPPRTRPRALQLDGASEPKPTETLRASRGVRLTVLPPLKGSNVNMTTSHGGLLQVESTFESVEQAKQKFDKKQNMPKIKGKRKRRKPYKKTGNKNVENTSQQMGTLPQFGDPGAVMAAVGAGMIPATMAMMVPIAMSG